MKKFVQRSYYGGLRESVLEQLSAKDRKDYQRGSAMLKALGDPQRAMLVDALSCRPLCVYEMQQLVSWSQATLSHHLKTLPANGLVNTTRDGKWIVQPQPGRHCRRQRIYGAPHQRTGHLSEQFHHASGRKMTLDNLSPRKCFRALSLIFSRLCCTECKKHGHFPYAPL